jgi:hypothetical protein
VTPRAQHVAGRDQGGGELLEADVPLVAPHLKVDVDDVVVGDRHEAQAVADRERAPFVGRAVVPDDAVAAVDGRRPVRPRRVRAALLDTAAGAVRLPVLEHERVRDHLSSPVGDVAIPAAERPVEVVGDVLLDEQRAVRLDGDADVGGGERERLRAGRRSERERRDERC